MEEASLDHGIDRLPFFSKRAWSFLALLALSFAPKSHATTFGPINLSEQLQRTQYVAFGMIEGSSWVMMDSKLNRPFTHWKLAIKEQPKGESLGGEVTIRQPGGELGAMGYHVAGSARFQPGEEVFVNLQDTEDPRIKDVIGLASGKFTVERSTGKEKIVNGIGFPLLHANGSNFTVSSFSDFIKRVSQGRETEEDRGIFINKRLAHDHDPALEARIEQAKKLASQPTISLPRKGDSQLPGGQNAQERQLNSSQETTADSEESSKGSSLRWLWILSIGVAALAVSAFVISRR